MNFRVITMAGVLLALAGCTTTSISKNGIESRWNGQPAGAFFAKFGPPAADSASGGTTLYTWRGGYKTRTIAAVYEDLGDGKKGKLLKPARSEYLRCEVQLTVSSDYVIRGVRTLLDRPGTDGGKSYCEEFLTAE